MKYKVDLALVRGHCNLEPYLKLIRSEIRQGGGFVHVHRKTNDMAGVYAAGTFNHFLGLVWVPVSSLTEAV